MEKEPEQYPRTRSGLQIPREEAEKRIQKQIQKGFDLLPCPPKTDPEVMLGSVHRGGRKDGKTHSIFTGADHHQIA
jgi:hypothetical protein